MFNEANGMFNEANGMVNCSDVQPMLTLSQTKWQIPLGETCCRGGIQWNSDGGGPKIFLVEGRAADQCYDLRVTIRVTSANDSIKLRLDAGAALIIPSGSEIAM